MMKENVYQPRTYRHWIESKDLVAFNVTEKETDLYIRARADFQKKAHRMVLKYRYQLEGFIKRNPAFLKALEPVPVPKYAPRIVLKMTEAASEAGVGPMAAVAGALAESVGGELLTFSPEVIVENGGDIFMKSLRKRTVGIFAGDSPLSGEIGLEIDSRETPVGICTSSGTVGHSLSYGRADAVVVISDSATLADAAATAIGNKVSHAADIDEAIKFGQTIRGLKGIVIIKDDSVGVWGEVKLCETSV